MKTELEKLQWLTVKKKVNELIPQAINPRKITDKQMNSLKKSLSKYNLVEIPVADADGTILAGHQRLKAMKLLGRDEEIIDIRVPNRRLTEEEAKEYLIASNAIGGDWDFDLLKSFDMGMLLDVGFDDMELSKFWKQDKKEESFEIEKELKSIKEPITKLGDIIQLGDHRLMCGDATDPEVIKKLMNGTKADMINQDPPFNIDLNYGKGVGGGRNKKDYGGNVKDDLSDLEYWEFIKKMMTNALAHSNEDCHVFYWCDEKYVWVFQTLYNELGVENRRLCIWVKNNASPTPQVAFNKATEFCCYGTKGTPYLNDSMNSLNEIVNAEVGTGNQLFDDINLFLTKRLPGHQYNHPTEKAPELHHKAIKRCTKLKSIILDLTAGSGSILIAAEQLGRTAYLCEMNPIFCDLIVRRYEAFTGNKVTYEKT